MARIRDVTLERKDLPVANGGQRETWTFRLDISKPYRFEFGFNEGGNEKQLTCMENQPHLGFERFIPRLKCRSHGQDPTVIRYQPVDEYWCIFAEHKKTGPDPNVRDWYLGSPTGTPELHGPNGDSLKILFDCSGDPAGQIAYLVVSVIENE